MESAADDLATGMVTAIAIEGSNVYAGGYFGSTADEHWEGMARWDGSRWHSAGMVSGLALCLAVAGGNVYAGGYGTELDSPLWRGVARWDGTSWHDMGERPPIWLPVYGLAAEGTNVYAVGSRNGEIPELTGVGRWDGQHWQNLIGSDGLPICASGTAIVAQDGRLFIAGRIDIPGLGEGLLMWEDGWTLALDQAPWRGSFQRTLGMAAGHGRLYVCGRFTDRSGTVAINVAAWDGQSWSALSSGVCNGLYETPLSIAANEQGVFVGGLSVAGEIVVNNVARWDGTNWHSVGSGLDGAVCRLAAKDTNVYAAVMVWNNSMTSIVSNYVARWNGTAWLTIGQAAGVVRDIALGGGEVYVTGDFASIGGTEVNGLARWDGSEWHSVGDGVPGQGWGEALGVLGTNIFVSVFQGSEEVVTNLLRWDGTRWTVAASSQRDLIGGFTVVPYVDAIVSEGDDVYIGGDFNWLNGRRIDKVARWDGQARVGLGSAGGLSLSRVTVLQFVGTDLYAGRMFTESDQTVVPNASRWDGAQWHLLGSGLNGGVYGIAACGRDVFFIGGFSRAGGKPSMGIARWTAPKTAPALGVRQTGAQTISLTFPTAVDMSYVLERSDFLEASTWVTLATKAGDGMRFTISDDTGETSRRFYRLRAF